MGCNRLLQSRGRYGRGAVLRRQWLPIAARTALPGDDGARLNRSTVGAARADDQHPVAFGQIRQVDLFRAVFTTPYDVGAAGVHGQRRLLDGAHVVEHFPRLGEEVRVLELVDSLIPQLTSLQPDVLVVTGDHSTPSALAGHSWHPVPVILSAKTVRRDLVTSFDERSCSLGGLGRQPMMNLMGLALAHAGRLQKFGA